MALKEDTPMPRFFALILALILACYIAPPALQAQHHGGGGGSHVGGGGGGVHAGAGVTSRPAGSLGRPVAPFVNPPVTTFGRAPAVLNRGFVRPVRPVVVAPVLGYGYGYGYGYPGYYPFDYSSQYYAPAASEPYYQEQQPVYVPGPGDGYGAQSDADLSYQVGRLTQEVEDLRQQQAQAAPARSTSSMFSPVVLIFKDGHRMEIQNYAVIGQTLWVLDEKNSTKIPVDDLDLEATQRENLAHGVRFSVPSR